MKKINLVIDKCKNCPYLRSESEWPEMYCGHRSKEMTNRFLCTERERLNKIEIPEWCPLENTKE